MKMEAFETRRESKRAVTPQANDGGGPWGEEANDIRCYVKNGGNACRSSDLVEFSFPCTA